MRQDHQRQVRVDHPEHDRELVVEQAHGAVDEPEPPQHAVDEPLVVQDHDPRVRTDQQARPEREDHEHEQRELPPARPRGDEGGDRVADEQRDQRRLGGDPEREPEDAPVERVPRAPVVVPREVVDDAAVVASLEEAVREHEADGQREQPRPPEEGGADRERTTRSAALHAGLSRQSRRPSGSTGAAPCRGPARSRTSGASSAGWRGSGTA